MYVKNEKNETVLQAWDTVLDLSLQGGGILVEQGGTADLEESNIFDNAAKEVCSTFEPAFLGGKPLLD